MRFFEKLCQFYTGRPDPYIDLLQERLTDEATKRILFDSRQAALFAHLGEAPPDRIQRKLILPFHQFYVELTEPIAFGESLPVCEEDDGDEGEVNNELRALLVFKSVWFSELQKRLHPVNFFFTTGGEWFTSGFLASRGFYFHLETGTVYTQKKTLMEMSEGLGKLGDIVEMNTPGSREMVEVTAEGLVDFPEEARMWCENILKYAGLLSWLLTYMMAKGVQIQPERVSRQQRRLMTRQKLPQQWHVVVVEPQVRSVRGSLDAEELGSRHRYRYDVMGHLRFGRHKLKSGAYRDTVEVVRPHQRGLANELYIPKVSHFKGGYRAALETKRYFQGELVEA